MTETISMRSPHYGGFWIRFLAAILDAIIIGIPAVLLQLGLVFVTGIESLGYLIQLAAFILTVYLVGAYGGTPGKLILGIRVVNENGTYVGFPVALLRELAKFLSMIILLIGYLMIAWDKRKQGLHDKIAKTFVVYK